MIASARCRRPLPQVLLLAIVASGGAVQPRAIAAPQAATAASLVLVVRIANNAKLGRDALVSAQARAVEIYEAAGVSLQWRDVNELEQRPQDSTGQSVDVLVVLASSRLTGVICGVNGLSEQALGVAMVRERRLAYVFIDRITEVAVRKRLLPAMIIGEVIAHEVGHLLLPDHAHGTTGVMRGTLDAHFHAPAQFTPAQAEALRATLTQR